MRRFLCFIILLISFAFTSISVDVGQAQENPVVHLVLFWKDSCGNCHIVLEQVIPPLQAQYGKQLDIILIELQSAADIDGLFATASALGFSTDEIAVPFLVIGNETLIGSSEIQNELPGLISSYLGKGGIKLPDIPPLRDLLLQKGLDGSIFECGDKSDCEVKNTDVEKSDLSIVTNPVPAGPFQATKEAQDNFTNGIILAVLIMVGMLVAIGYTIFAFVKGKKKNIDSSVLNWRDIAIPLLTIMGMGVAIYLTYIETSTVEAFCGPIGDCNAVQNSQYAKLFGIIPVGLIGLIAYAVILFSWIIARFRSGNLSNFAWIAVLGMALIGTLFSVYLTYLEIWVIKAVCIWCLSSAIIITLLMLVSTTPAINSWESADEED